MPAAALKSMAKRAGVSPKRAERIWNKVKAATAGKGKDKWAYTMGAVKNALKIESAIDRILEGEAEALVLNDLVNGKIDPSHARDTFIHEGEIPGPDKTVVRTYFDSYGELKFSTTEGVLIHELTPLMKFLSEVSDSASSDSGIVELMDGFEGTPEQLYDKLSTRYSF